MKNLRCMAASGMLWLAVAIYPWVFDSRCKDVVYERLIRRMLRGW